MKSNGKVAACYVNRKRQRLNKINKSLVKLIILHGCVIGKTTEYQGKTDTSFEVSVSCNCNLDSNSGMAAITARANELILQYPDKRALFEGYVRSQQNEYDDIDDSLVCVTWILKKLPSLCPEAVSINSKPALLNEASHCCKVR